MNTVHSSDAGVLPGLGGTGGTGGFPFGGSSVPGAGSARFPSARFNEKYIPASFPMLHNKGSSLLSFISYYILFGRHDAECAQEEGAQEGQRVSHEISYTSGEVQDFLKRLEAGKVSFQEVYESETNSTIVITVLLGKLLLQEIPLTHHSQVLSNIQLASANLSFLAVAKVLNFGTRRWDPNHSLLKKKNIALKKKENKQSLSLGFDTGSHDTYASFCEMPKDDSFLAFMASAYNMLADPSTEAHRPDQPPAANASPGTPSASQNPAHTYPSAQASSAQNPAEPSADRSSRSSSFSSSPYAAPFAEDVIIQRGNILYTLLFLVLFFPFDSQNTSLLTLLETWIQARGEAANLKPSPDDETDFIDERCIEAPADLALPLLQFQSDFQLISELDSHLPELDMKAAFCVADSLLYLKLRHLMAHEPSSEDSSSPKSSHHITETVNNILEQFLVLLKRPERNLINLFTFLNFLLPKLYITQKNLEKIQEIMLCAKQQFMEPLPIGGLAKSILLTCKRKLLHFDSIERDNLMDSLQKTNITKEGINGTEPLFRRRTVHILYNPYSQHASHLTEKLDLTSPSVDEHSDIYHAMANHMLNIFENASLLDDELLRAPQELLSKYFYSTHNFLKEIENGERPESKRQLFLQNLKQSILSESSSFTTVNGEHDSLTTPTKVKRQRCPPLPKPHLNVVVLPKEVELETCKMERRIFPRSCVVDALQKIITQSEEENALTEDSKLVISVAVAGGSGSLQRLAHSLVVANRLHIDKPMGKGYSVDLQVYMIPLGVNNHLSTWLEKHDPFYSRYWHMPMVSPLNVGKSLSNATFTGGVGSQTIRHSEDDSADESPSSTPIGPYQSEAFERRERARKSFLYTPVHTYRADPKSEESSDGSDGKLKLVASPAYSPKAINNELLNHYLNEARTKLPVHVYTAQCLCYDVSKRDLRNRDSTPNGGTSSSTSGSAPAVQRGNSVVEYISLSFCQRLDVGIVAEAAHMIQKNEEFRNMRMEEVIGHKDFKYQGLQLSLSYVPMDPSGLTPSSQIIEKPSVYQSICVKSTSIPGDSGALASPASPWLEVLCEDSMSQKRRSGGNSHHVAQLIIDSSTAGKFNILVDGEVYGPYHKIILSRDNKVKSFEVMSFGRPRINL